MFNGTDIFEVVYDHPLLSRIRQSGARAVSGSALKNSRHPYVKLSVRLARKLGRNSLVAGIVRGLKRGHSTDRETEIPVNNLSREVIEDALDFVRLARATGMLSRKTVVFRPGEVVVRPLSSPEAINFFTGGWLEVCVAVVTHRFLANPRRPGLGPLFRIKLESQPGTVHAEIDGAAMLRQGQVLLLVEAKTNPYVPLRFIRLAQALGVCLKHRLLVTATALPQPIAPNECTTMSIRKYVSFLRCLRRQCR